MKCPNCSSQMFVTDETANSRSHVTFYRCSLCVSEHVSSQPIQMMASEERSSGFDTPTTQQPRYQMA